MVEDHQELSSKPCLFFFFYFHNDAKKEEEITQTVSSSSFRRIEREHDVLFFFFFFLLSVKDELQKNHPIPAISRIILSSMHLPIFDTVPLIAQSLPHSLSNSLQLSPSSSPIDIFFPTTFVYLCNDNGYLLLTKTQYIQQHRHCCSLLSLFSLSSLSLLSISTVFFIHLDKTQRQRPTSFLSLYLKWSESRK